MSLDKEELDACLDKQDRGEPDVKSTADVGQEDVVDLDVKGVEALLELKDVAEPVKDVSEPVELLEEATGPVKAVEESADTNAEALEEKDIGDHRQTDLEKLDEKDPRDFAEKPSRDLDAKDFDKKDLEDIETPDDSEKGESDGAVVDQLPSSELTTVLEFPEGGWQAWLTIFGAWLVQFSTFGYINSFGVYNDYYVRQYLANKTSSDIGWIGSVQVFMVLSSGIVTGQLFDKGYFHHLMIAGALLYGFSIFMLSLSHEYQYYQVFLSHGLGVGLACGLMYVPSFGIVSHYFNRRRAIAMGIVASGSSLGAVIHPIMLNKLFHGATGFHNGVRTSAGLNFSLLILANVLMQTRLPARGPGPVVNIAHFARDLPYVLVVIAAFLMILGLFFPIFYLQLNAIVHGVDPNLAFYSLAILNATSFIGRLAPVALIPTFGVFNIMIAVATPVSVIIFCLLAVKTLAATMVFAIVFGFFSGAIITLLAPLLASLARDQNEIGARLGICFTFMGIAGLFGTPIAGALLSSHYAWWRPTLFAGIATAACSGCIITTRQILVARRGTQKV